MSSKIDEACDAIRSAINTIQGIESIDSAEKSSTLASLEAALARLQKSSAPSTVLELPFSPTTQADISGWLQEGKSYGATHMLVVCDSFDLSDYPVYVSPREDVRAIFDQYNGKNMQRVMEVYRLDLPFEEQLNASRVFNF